ncbi:phosphotransferase [Amycolatopsis sp. CA-126428]|uniref:phosphotransferase n=1 Tax=Amycolatopsis sp. CA-126428 TaxID=2073158 RepID=UPI001E3B55E4|nr:phosphotransferase [Amycolatopsis sp. CA-126428]
MIERFGWDALPEAVRDEVQAHIGDVTVIRDVAEGQNCNLALVVRGDAGEVFLKGVVGISPRMRWLRNEAAAGDLVRGIAPSTRFSADIEPEWFVVGFEYVEGRAADFTPGSSDLEIVASTVAEISRHPAGPAAPLSERWASSDWWVKLEEVAPDQVADWDLEALTKWSALTADLVGGTSLLHTDLHEHQFLISDPTASVRVIDWGRPAAGAAWVDDAFLVIRLIAAGHQPAEAERWAASIPSWSAGSDEAVTSFACYVAGLWSYRGTTSPFPGASGLSRAAKTYARYRLAK